MKDRALRRPRASARSAPQPASAARRLRELWQKKQSDACRYPEFAVYGHPSWQPRQLEPKAARAYAARMAQSSHERDEAQRREALRTLETLNERDTFVNSAMARSAKRASDHFAARDAAGEDRIELLGRRIGRGLSLAGFVALAIYLYVTYLAK